MIEFGVLDGQRFVRCEVCGTVSPVETPETMRGAWDGRTVLLFYNKKVLPGGGGLRGQSARGDPYLGGI